MLSYVEVIDRKNVSVSESVTVFEGVSLCDEVNSLLKLPLFDTEGKLDTECVTVDESDRV